MVDEILRTPASSTEAGEQVRVNLLGRYMLADRREFPCQVVDASPYRMRVAAPVSGSEGERVIVYVDLLGRLEGTIEQPWQNGFCMTLAATARKREKLAAQLSGLANQHSLPPGQHLPRGPVSGQEPFPT